LWVWVNWGSFQGPPNWGTQFQGQFKGLAKPKLFGGQSQSSIGGFKPIQFPIPPKIFPIGFNLGLGAKPSPNTLSGFIFISATNSRVHLGQGPFKLSLCVSGGSFQFFSILVSLPLSQRQLPQLGAPHFGRAQLGCAYPKRFTKFPSFQGPNPKGGANLGGPHFGVLSKTQANWVQGFKNFSPQANSRPRTSPTNFQGPNFPFHFNLGWAFKPKGGQFHFFPFPGQIGPRVSPLFFPEPPTKRPGPKPKTFPFSRGPNFCPTPELLPLFHTNFPNSKGVLFLQIVVPQVPFFSKVGFPPIPWANAFSFGGNLSSFLRHRQFSVASAT